MTFQKTEDVRCSKCVFWNSHWKRGSEGECRCRSPINQHGRFPETKDDDWCGEFQPKENASDLGTE